MIKLKKFCMRRLKIRIDVNYLVNVHVIISEK